MTTRAEIVAIARSFIDTPWVPYGRLPGVGLDCAGVLVCAARASGGVPYTWDLPPYKQEPDGHTMIEWCNKFMGARLNKADMKPGDAIVLVTDQHPQHLGILGDYLHGGLSLIHASNVANPKRVVETRLMFSRAQRFIAAYTFPGIALWGL